MMFKLVLVLLVCLCNIINSQVQFRVIRQWKYINYTWISPDAYRTAIENDVYIPENIIMTGITNYDNYFYVTMPRMKRGVPATLGRISALQGQGIAPLIEPFPSWDFNKINECGALQNVQNLEIDPNGTMYILDGGHSHFVMETPVENCPAQLVIYDMHKNTTISTYVFPDNVASVLYDLVIDGDFVYITDNSADDFGIIIYSRQANRSWKIRHSASMRADPIAQNFIVNGYPVNSPINIAGIALSPKMQGSDRELFYSPASSFHLYSISTTVLQNEENSNNGKDYPGQVNNVGIKSSQTDRMIMTNHGVLYYGLLSGNSIAGWNSIKPFASNQKTVSKDVNYIQWTSAFTIDTNGTITVLSNTLQSFLHKGLDTHRYNFWLLSAEIGERSYLYDDPAFVYKPVITTEKTSEPAPTKEIEIAPDGKGRANLHILELSLILVSVCAWMYIINIY